MRRVGGGVQVHLAGTGPAPGRARPKPLPKRPTIRPERQWAQATGAPVVAGIDEAGRGTLAGPVVAAAVALDLDGVRPGGLRDSKTLSDKQRQKVRRAIINRAMAWGVGVATATEVDALNILEATRLAALRAIDAMPVRPGALVTDALDIPMAGLPTLALVKGDRVSASIAAASIMAKTTRDQMMDDYHREFPEFHWDRNRGYGTADHLEALNDHGPTVLHRMTFRGVGFFDHEQVRSRSFNRLAAAVRSCLPTAGTLASLRSEVEALRGQLPPDDYHELHAMLDERGTTVAGNG